MWREIAYWLHFNSLKPHFTLWQSHRRWREKIKSDNGTITTCGKETDRYGKRCYAVIYRERRYAVLSLLPLVRNPVRGGLWRRTSPLPTSPSRAQTQQAFLTTRPLLCPHSLLPEPTRYPAPSPMPALSNPQETLPSVFAAHPQLPFSLKVTWRRIILPSVVPSTHSKKKKIFL